MCSHGTACAMMLQRAHAVLGGAGSWRMARARSTHSAHARHCSRWAMPATASRPVRCGAGMRCQPKAEPACAPAAAPRRWLRLAQHTQACDGAPATCMRAPPPTHTAAMPCRAMRCACIGVRIEARTPRALLAARVACACRGNNAATCAVRVRTTCTVCFYHIV